MKYLKKFENYILEMVSIDKSFGISDLDIAFFLSYLIDGRDYLSFDVISNNPSKFEIEIFSDNVKNKLNDEYGVFKNEMLDGISKSFEGLGLKIYKHEYNKDRNRIIIYVSKTTSLKESVEKLIDAESKYIDCEMTLIEKRGRKWPIFSGYRPLFVLGDENSDCEVTFDKEQIRPGETEDVTIRILHPDKFDKLEKGVKFMLKEGAKLVAVGAIK